MEDIWKCLKLIITVVFRGAIGYDEIPKESRYTLRLGFYDIIIKPIFEFIDGVGEVTKNLEFINFLREIVKPAFEIWLENETNLTIEFRDWLKGFSKFEVRIFKLVEPSKQENLQERIVKNPKVKLNSSINKEDLQM